MSRLDPLKDLTAEEAIIEGPDATLICKVLESLPEWMKNIMMSYPVVLAGGFIRDAVMDNPVRDIDLFISGRIPNAQSIAAEVASLVMKEYGDGADIVELDRKYKVIPDENDLRTHPWLSDDDEAYDVEDADNTEWCNVPVEVVFAVSYETPKELISGFDFTIAQAALWYVPDEWRTAKCVLYDTHVQGMILTWSAGKNWKETSLERVCRMYAKGFVPRYEVGPSGELNDVPKWDLHQKISFLEGLLSRAKQDLRTVQANYEKELEALRNDNDTKKEMALLERVKLKAQMAKAASEV